MEWINIKDQMPEPESDVLIYQEFSKWDRKGRVIQARVYFTEGLQGYGGPNSLTGSGLLTGYYFAVPAICNPETVTHWMPLPKPPKN